jgi:hypothetical protein
MSRAPPTNTAARLLLSSGSTSNNASAIRRIATLSRLSPSRTIAPLILPSSPLSPSPFAQPPRRLIVPHRRPLSSDHGAPANPNDAFLRWAAETGVFAPSVYLGSNRQVQCTPHLGSFFRFLHFQFRFFRIVSHTV